MAGHFRHNAIFIGGNVRDAINDGRADYTPVYLSEIEELFESGAMPLDVALIQVSPPDVARLLQLWRRRGHHADRCPPGALRGRAGQ